MIWLSLFTNMGSFISYITGFTRELFVGCIIILTSILERRKIIISRKVINISLALIMICLLGLLNLLFNPNMANVAPMDISYDEIVLTNASLKKASFSDSNIGCLGYLLIFVIVMVICHNYLVETFFVSKIIDFLIKSCSFFFFLIIIESIIVNIFGLSQYRAIMIQFFGGDISKAYSFSTSRFLGIKSAFGFFSEPSYVSGPLLTFYLIQYVKGKADNKTMILFFISFLVALLSGSTTCLVIMLFGILTLTKIIAYNQGIYLEKRIILLFGIMLIALITIILLLETPYILESFRNSIDKVLAFITNSKTSNLHVISGYIRSYGNLSCLNIIFTNPLFGVGLGTTRGFGFIPTAIASFGIFGSITLVLYYKCILNIKLKKDVCIPFLFLIVILYNIYGNGYIYSCLLIALTVCFNTERKNIIHKEI